MHIRVGPLVRAVDTTSAVIWAEFSQPGIVTLSATSPDTPSGETLTASARTVSVGGRYYAAPQLQGLQPATWYTYEFVVSATSQASNSPGESLEASVQLPSLHIQCFRTLDEYAQMAPSLSPLRLAYGSCRKLNEPETDALGAFSSWLLHYFDEREQVWPHLLLLIGDQIYADQPPNIMLQQNPQLKDGASSFEDFALLYTYAWTHDMGIRQVLATIPSYMIFDDHEITNDWNISPTWRATAIQQGREQMLIDGLVAYWIYQGWGNLSRRSKPTGNSHPLLSIIQEAEQNGADVLETLRDCIRLEVHGKAELQWHYQIPTTPAIFVANARAGRTSVFSNEPELLCAPTRIMSEQQMNDLRDWLHAHTAAPAILISSVPVVLPPVIGLAEYLAGIRLWQQSAPALRKLGLQLARIQQRLIRMSSFDHWPTYSTTWEELMRLLDERHEDLIVLSGDVHFSYAIEAHRTSARGSQAHLYQYVSTPFQNALSSRDRQLILAQARIGRLSYSGLHTRMLPLYTGDNKGRIQYDLLMKNTIALMTLQPGGDGRYDVQHEYVGVVDGEPEVIGRVYTD